MADLGAVFRAPKAAFAKAADSIRNLLRRSTASHESDEVMRRMAQFAQDRLQQGILKGRPGWPALSDMTKEMKGHGKPLVDTGEFVEGITHWKAGGAWHAGLFPTAIELQRIGEVHEHGAFIQVTDRMRKFFLATDHPLRADTLFVRVPPRPWFEPARREVEENAKAEMARLQEKIAKETEKKLARDTRGEASQIAQHSQAGVARAGTKS